MLSQNELIKINEIKKHKNDNELTLVRYRNIGDSFLFIVINNN